MKAREVRAAEFALQVADFELAQAKAALVAAAPGRHLVLQCNHPSPLSAKRGPVPFIGCGHFGLARDFLRSAEPAMPLLDWRLELPAANGAGSSIHVKR